MLLSELVFTTIKKVLGSTETDLTYNGFVNGDYKDDYRVVEANNSVFFPINQAIARLADLDKLPHKLIKLLSIDGQLLLPKEGFRSVIAVQDYYDNQYEFVKVDAQELLIKNQTGKERMLVEVTKDIFFNDSYEEDLSDYGITNNMCLYIVEYAYGKILEETSPSEASVHINTAESYFAGLPTAPRILKQRLNPKHTIL